MNSVFALGNFDGVHRGHCATLAAAVEKARALGVPAKVLTFEPHPRTFFQPHLAPFRLTPANVKERLLKAFGIDEVVVLPFGEDIAHMSAADFMERILVKQLGAKHIVAGHDFVFGHKRDGNMKKLSETLLPMGVGVTEIDELGDDGELFSSTRVRELLLEGEVEAAAKILGRPWSLEGTVIKGAALGGKTIGFPTANIDLGDYLRPRFGVYAIHAGPAGSALSFRGVANIGIRPTVYGKGDNLEAFLFDFNQDIYAQQWAFALAHFIRPEQKFDNLEALRAQISEDVEMGRRFLG